MPANSCAYRTLAIRSLLRFKRQLAETRMADNSSKQHTGPSVLTDSTMVDGTDDIEFQILDIESQILDVASTLAGILHFTSIDRYIVSPDRLTALSPENRLRFLKLHHSRLKEQVDSHRVHANTQANVEPASRAPEGTLSADRTEKHGAPRVRKLCHPTS